MSRFDRYLDAAVAGFEAGFASKAAQKNALDDLNRAADDVRNDVHNGLLAIARDDRADNWNDLYYSFPALHVWKAKHADAYAAYPEAVSRMNRLAELREAIKAAPINAPVRDAGKERVETVRKSLIEIMEARKASFVEGVRLVEVFGKLPVSVSAHYVTNDKGTTFLRHFFYLNGKLTALNVILAVLDATRED